MTYTADPVYGKRPWGQPPLESAGINQTHEKSMVTQALTTADYSRDDIRATVTGPLPIDSFPPRYGYRTTAFGIEDVVALDNIWERRDFSGSKSGYQGTSYPALNNVW